MAWQAKTWGSASDSDRSRLPKGKEACHICGDDESLTDVKLQPCGHEICLPCCNRMRQGIVLKVRRGAGG